MGFAAGLLLLALTVMAGATTISTERHRDTSLATSSDRAVAWGDRETPPHQVADECTDSMKRRRLSDDWLAVESCTPVFTAAASAQAELGIHAVRYAALVDCPLADEFVSTSDVSRTWSSLRLRVCLGRAPPQA